MTYYAAPIQYGEVCERGEAEHVRRRGGGEAEAERRH